jgi:glycerophosphoryl diester phosphodiesterase
MAAMTLLTRRALATHTMATAALAGTLAPGLGFAGSARTPIVIAHRGASGLRPEHTGLAYDLAIDQGCDFIEPDLVPTKDGHLIARHENEIGGTTDVASRPEFADRKATKTIDGQPVTGWFTEDFTLAEIKTLRARERLPQLRPGNTKYDGQAQLLTFDEVVAIARAGSRRTGRTIGVYPEMKHPGYFASLGLPVEDRLVALLRKNDLDSATAPVFVQCFEVTPLKTIRAKTKARLVLLTAGAGGPADLPNVTYSQLVSPSGLKEVALYADGLGPERSRSCRRTPRRCRRPPRWSRTPTPPAWWSIPGPCGPRTTSCRRACAAAMGRRPTTWPSRATRRRCSRPCTPPGWTACSATSRAWRSRRGGEPRDA